MKTTIDILSRTRARAAAPRGAGGRVGAWLRLAALALSPLLLLAALAPGAQPPALVLALAIGAMLAAVPASASRGRHETSRLRDLVARQGRQLEAHARIRRVLRSVPTSSALARAALRVLAAECGARAGCFYLVRGGQALERAAHEGAGWCDELSATLRLGEGAAGRAAATRRRLVEAHPGGGTIVAVPYHLAGRVKGAAVFLFAGEPGEEALEFLADTAEPVAAALEVRRSRERVQLLLAETRRHAAAYAAQQRELQRTNVRLQRSDRYKNEFLANMTHELRSPLNSMLLLSQVLAENRRGRLGPEDVDAAQVINKAGRELLVIIDDILDLTKAEAGRLELHPETVLVADLAESLIALYRPLAQRRGLGLSVVVEPGAPGECVTDPTRLSQILKNLLNNALKFTERGEVSLRIAAARDAGAPALEFVVADTGIGISPEVLPALFAPFTQGDGSISRRFGGSGLGLSICRKLAELLGARIEVASEVGRGSTFTLRLPLAAPAPTAAGPLRDDVPAPMVTVRPAREPGPPPAPAGAPGPAAGGGSRCAPPARADALAGRSVLVVDGDMRSAFQLSARLEAAGARVRVVRDAASALAVLEAAPAPELALVRPQALVALTEAGQREWWEAAGAVTRVVVIATMVPASALVPPTLPVLDPGMPADRLGAALAGLAAAVAARPPGLEVAPC